MYVHAFSTMNAWQLGQLGGHTTRCRAEELVAGPNTFAVCPLRHAMPAPAVAYHPCLCARQLVRGACTPWCVPSVGRV